MYHRSVPLIGGVAALAGKRVAVFGAGLEGQSLREAGRTELCRARRPRRHGGRPPRLRRPRPTGPRRELGRSRRALPGGSRGARLRLRRALARRLALRRAPRGRGAARRGRDDSDGAFPGGLLRTGRSSPSPGPRARPRPPCSRRPPFAPSGSTSSLAGNIGRPVTELYDDDDHDVFVVELSSFQTAEVTTSPTVGVLTLLAPDHLDWHRSLENYYRRQAAPLLAPPRRARRRQRLLRGGGGPQLAPRGQSPLRRRRPGAPRRREGRRRRPRPTRARGIPAARRAQPRKRLRRRHRRHAAHRRHARAGRLERELCCGAAHRGRGSSRSGTSTESATSTTPSPATPRGPSPR